MFENKKNTFELLKFPEQVIGLIFTISLILLLSPYFDDTDFGIFRIPLLNHQVKTILQYLGPILFVVILLLFVPVWNSPGLGKYKSSNSLSNTSKYRVQLISEIVKGEANLQGLNLEGIEIGNRFTINDLTKITNKIYYPNKSFESINTILQAARAKAFSLKYAEPKEDEKLIEISKIKFDNVKQWETYFLDLLNDLKINDFNSLDILSVGIGNGYAEHTILKDVHFLRAVDISAESLDYAKKKLPNLKSYICPAEDLSEIPNHSVDLYLSLRVYQSSLFDKRAALHEALRVLRFGGVIIISIPKMYLNESGDVVYGLVTPNSPEPNIDKAKNVAIRTRDYLKILNFKNVRIDNRSPFEIYVCGKR